MTSEEDDVDACHFLEIVRRVLREALDGLLSASEVSLREKLGFLVMLQVRRRLLVLVTSWG